MNVSLFLSVYLSEIVGNHALLPHFTHISNRTVDKILGVTSFFLGSARGKEDTCQYRRCERGEVNPCVGKIL